MDKMREEFELWAKNEGYYTDTIDDYITAEMDGLPSGSYRSYETRVSWQSWKASRAVLCVELPCGYIGHPYRFDILSAIDDCRIALEDSGVECK